MVEEKRDTTPLVVGVDLGGTQIRASVLQGAELLSRANTLTGENPTPERVLPRLFATVEQAIEQAGISPEEISGIGIACPGPLNNRTGEILSPPNLPGWDHTPLRTLFQERYQMPIYVENDANVAALGEYMFGAGQGCNEMVYLTISTGIGGGVIAGGQILEGVAGMAGELGHITIDWRGPICNCGNIGCLERLASGTGIALEAQEAIAQGKAEELLEYARQTNVPPTQIDARVIGEAAKAGIPVARDIIEKAGEALGFGLVNIIHIFNPEKIILGGGLTQMGDILLQPAYRIVEKRTMREPHNCASIALARLGANVGLIGAGALVYHLNR
ncbi:glucokinase [Thermosporothrix hazakensis]|uniref:Glucokinase n=1 Tax=Thermosporothrix hazakensis TaxID=644383 RepID=A0A326TZM3_THEHA|nr:ROK family protein [Thermosporothrix hazakensis]PZW22177.1 glucokinase [Thermosporothrix hazakensis]GCE48100.1 N-acylmannosamine kinase [Thermosporothrix hazakensis]